MFRVEAPLDKYYRRSDTNRQKLIHKAKMKSLRISVVIVAAFIICWTPYYVMMVIFMFLNPDKRVINKQTIKNSDSNEMLYNTEDIKF